MNEILHQRRALLATLVALTIFAHGVVRDMVLPSLGSLPEWAMLSKFVLMGGALYSGIVLLPISLFDRFIWRWLNPTYDVSGTWKVELYELWPLSEKHITNAGRDAVRKYQEALQQNSGQALIRQTPFRVWVQEASGFSAVTPAAGVTLWTAEAVAVRLPGRMNVVFEASADGGHYSGRDALVVTRRDWKGRPIEMTGDAFHVLKHLDITIKGAIRYSRIERRSINRLQPSGGSSRT